MQMIAVQPNKSWTRAAGACFSSNRCGKGCFDSRRTFGIVLAQFHNMRRLLAAILFISLAFTPYVTVAQKNSQ
jgi:hypothetical protein